MFSALVRIGTVPIHLFSVSVDKTKNYCKVTTSFNLISANRNLKHNIALKVDSKCSVNIVYKNVIYPFLSLVLATKTIKSVK